MTIDEAFDSVLRDAVATKDDAIIEAYRHIFHGSSSQVDAQAALRLGLLVGRKLGALCTIQQQGAAHSSTDQT